MAAKKSILVTGASGFLGSRLKEGLERENKNNHFLFYFTAAKERKEAGIHGLDFTDFLALSAAIKEIKPEIVYHFGALVDLSRNFEVAQKCLDVNLKGTLNLLEALRAFPPKKFIFSSTEEVYGDNPLPFKEDQLPRPPSAYSISKIAGEHFCKLYAQELGFSLMIFRIGTFYGPGQPLSKFISQVITKALKNEDIPLNSGTKKRDYVYVDDVVEAVILAIKKDWENQIQTINLGGGKSYSLKELVDMVVKLTKSRSKVLVGAFPDRAFEADEWLMDNHQAKKLLDWRPKTSLRGGLKREIEYFKK